MRPRRIWVVTGTGTEVGKTWVGARVARHVACSGLTVAARKAAQSFEPGTSLTDAHVLAGATGEAPETVCPAHRWYPVPMAPPMAAAELGAAAASIDDLATEVDRSWPEHQIDVGLVEGAGGVASPLADDGDTADLARALQADRVLLVADAGLGTINLVRMSVGALAPLRVTVYLNHFEGSDRLHRANRTWLHERDHFEVVTAVEEIRL